MIKLNSAFVIIKDGTCGEIKYNSKRQKPFLYFGIYFILFVFENRHLPKSFKRINLLLNSLGLN